MTVQFYNDIETKLKTLTWFSYFKLFNNQFESMESQEEQSIPNFSIFMEFINSAPLITLGSGLKLYDCTVRFHLYFFTLDLQDLNILAYKNELLFILDGFFPSRSSQLNAINEDPDQNHNGYMVWKIDFETQIPVENKGVFNGKIDAAPVTLNLIGDLIIDNQIIRTGVLPL